LKGSTARSANCILGRTGQPFWQDESYDHYLRQGEPLDRIIAYIERNPVSAGLVSSPELWPWSSATRRKRLPHRLPQSMRQAKAPAPPAPQHEAGESACPTICPTRGPWRLRGRSR
jgi:hypothetical protein